MKPTPFGSILFGILFFSLFSSLLKAENINFISDTFQSIKQQSKAANKPFFVIFQSKKCRACKRMNRKAFRKKDLIKYSNTNFIAAKINLDKKEGESWQNLFEIKNFPTIIVFDTEGIVMNRYESPMTDIALLQEFRKNIVVIQNLNNEIVTEKKVLSKEEELGYISKKELLERSLFEVSEPISEDIEKDISQNIQSNNVVVLMSNHSPTKSQQTQNTSLKNKHAFDEKILEVGHYNEYEKSLAVLKRLRKESNYTIYIVPKKVGKQTTYRILLGEIESKAKAVKFLQKLDLN